MMNELLEWLEYIEDVRKERKVKHKPRLFMTKP